MELASEKRGTAECRLRPHTEPSELGRPITEIGPLVKLSETNYLV
eukprot:CAMPEP_0203905994 /NCGR_PEP_ID=MMETSP0359-20131031/47675_1 /ASSEMBLY_ACC=CAM_ASM_000338 /TAXON_ID=268821 /ORGANISM="Scrippsiella Hangoei, Strain SHTV-5" /LENGTH=44 /DNA_ID= /DNA_START= /DNA_END= /DNA_ORIENTATION=